LELRAKARLEPLGKNKGIVNLPQRSIALGGVDFPGNFGDDQLADEPGGIGVEFFEAGISELVNAVLRLLRRPDRIVGTPRNDAPTAIV